MEILEYGINDDNFLIWISVICLMVIIVLILINNENDDDDDDIFPLKEE